MTDTSSQTHEMTVTRTFDVIAEKVWWAWTTPEGFSGWFGTDPYRTPVDTVSMDLRPGGKWRATQVSTQDGSELPFAGHYREIEPGKRLVMTFDESDDANDPMAEVLTVELEPTDGRTKMTARQVGHLPAEQYPLLQQGYGLFFDRMEALLADM